MVLKCEPVFAAVEQLQTRAAGASISLPTAHRCRPLLRWSFRKQTHLVLLSGHYEESTSAFGKKSSTRSQIGDYVLTNGTLARPVVIDALARFIPACSVKKSR